MTEGLGAKHREVRTAKGMSLRSLAQALGVSASLISQVEIGKTQPSVSTLFAMANHLGVSLDELVGNVPTAGPSPVAPAPTPPDASTVGRAAEYPVIEMENGVRWEKLASVPCRCAAGDVPARRQQFRGGPAHAPRGSRVRVPSRG
ncbi:helix-turn-helix domain-containing protein [Microbacterium schleiferi]|uniref:helix-turn-helix domain-containing protein n=1 Tax=Microbacterium schleiferi TaxID=69362 RepID=UPI003CC97827